MKTLKKVLSLVLVVAMIASMLIVGAAAAEEETTLYEEAVAVVTGVGIIEGDENGYNFQGKVTREQAAKIIAYLLLGKETAEDLKVSAAPFADVAANRWSAGYIAYLKSQGIISGVSDTEFDPTAPVTGIAFAKMLLTAVGYGKVGEFEGKDWDINTITFANDNGVFTGTKAADLTKGATREEAMLYAFNVLTGVPVVNYNKTFEAYYTGASALNPVDGLVDPTAIIDVDRNYTPYYYTLAYSKYRLMQDPDNRDDFGRPAVTWTYYGEVIADSLTAMEPNAVLTGSVGSSTLYATLGKDLVKKLNENLVASIKFTDGVITEAPALGSPIVANEPLTNAFGGNGATNEIFIRNDLRGNWWMEAVTYYEYLAEVIKIDAAKNTMTIKELRSNDEFEVDGDDFDITGYAKKDLVVFTYAQYSVGEYVVGSIRPAEFIVGTYTGTDWMGNAVINGTAYTASAKDDGVYTDEKGRDGQPGTDGIDDTWQLAMGETYKFYLDGQGNILAVEGYDVAGATDTHNYLYVVKAEAQAYNEDTFDGKEGKVALTVVYAEGGKEVLYYPTRFDAVKEQSYFIFKGTRYYIIANNTLEGDDPIGDVFENKWFSYTLNDAGLVSLKDPNTDYTAQPGTFSIKTATASTGSGNKLANSNTVLTVINQLGQVAVYKGLNNFPEYDQNEATAFYTFSYKSNFANNIYLYVDGEEVDLNMNLAYCAMKLSTDENGVTYMFYTDSAIPVIATLEHSLAFVNTYSCRIPNAPPMDMDIEDDGTGYVYDLDYTDGVYSVIDDDNDADDGYAIDGFSGSNGVVNGGKYTDGYAALDFVTFTYPSNEWAVIDDIDGSYFTTVAVESDDFEDSNAYKSGNLSHTKVDGGVEIPAYTYYYDNNTVIVDTTGAGATTISEGDTFVAYIDKEASVAFNGLPYCTHIWIVG